MGHVVGAGVDHRQFPVADDVGACAKEGEGAGVVRHDPADQRRDAIRTAIFELHVLDERDHGGALPKLDT